MKNIETLAANIVNPSEIAVKNQTKDVPGSLYGPINITAGFHPIKFTKLYADKGVGRFLLAINEFPGCTKIELFKKIFGPDYVGAQFAETFTKMKAAKVIENRKPGYFITPLGLAVLKQHNLL